MPMKAQEWDNLLGLVKGRFEKNWNRHEGHARETLLARLEKRPPALTSLAAMEASAGEPEVFGFDQTCGQCLFCGCSAKSPAGRRS